MPALPIFAIVSVSQNGILEQDGTVLISCDRRFIFIHVAKTAGSSVRDALQHYGCGPGDRGWNRLLRENELAGPFSSVSPGELKHLSATKIRELLPAELFADCFKFAFVRNTWDQLVSTYFFILRDSTHERHEFVKSLSGFDDFVRWQALYPTAPQKNSVADDNGTLLVDFLGRFENLADDFQTVCQRLKIKARLPHVNATARRDYRSYYTDRTASLVEESFREDIEFFGFTFDGEVSRPVCCPGDAAGGRLSARVRRPVSVGARGRARAPARNSAAVNLPSVRCFERSPERRDKGRDHEYSLRDIAVITMLAVLSGAQSWADIREWAELQRPWLAKTLALLGGLPSPAVMRRVISRIDPAQFVAFSNECLATVGDMKTARHEAHGGPPRFSLDRPVVASPWNQVMVRAEKNHLMFGGPTGAANDGGTASVAKLIDLLDLGATVTIVDSQNCPPDMPRRIVDAGGNYVVALQGRHQTMCDAVRQSLAQNLGAEFADLALRCHATRKRDDGRTHERCYYQMQAPPELAGRDEWFALETIGVATSITRRDGRTAQDTRYIASSLPLSAQRLADALRGYWRTTGDLQWTLHVTLDAAARRPINDHAAVNLAAARRAAVSLLERYSGDERGARQRRLRAGWDRSYLLQVVSDTRDG